MKPERVSLLRGSSQTLQLIRVCFLFCDFTLLNQDVDKLTVSWQQNDDGNINQHFNNFRE